MGNVILAVMLFKNNIYIKLSSRAQSVLPSRASSSSHASFHQNHLQVVSEFSRQCNVTLEVN